MPVVIAPPKAVLSRARSPSVYIGMSGLFATAFVAVRGHDVLGLEGTATIASLALAILVPCFALAVWLRRREFRDVQQDRDRFAAELIACLRGNDTPDAPFSLYIRPFFTDTKLLADGRVRDPGQVLVSPSDLAELGHPRDAERAAAHALDGFAPLVALGKTERRLGAGKVMTTDQDWQDDFRRLSALAERIVVIPIAQPSTLWELTQIASDPALAGKTVFVRPANRFHLDFGFKPGRRLKRFSSIWEASRRMLRGVLPQLPPFAGGIRLLSLDGNAAFRSSHGDAMASTHHAGGMRPLLVDGMWRKPSRYAFPFWVTVAALLAAKPIPGIASPSGNVDLPGVVISAVISMAFWEWVWLPAMLAALYFLTSDSVPTKALRGLTLAMVFAAGLRIADGLLSFFLDQYGLDRALANPVLHALVFNDIVGHVSMAIGVSMFFRMLFDRWLIWPIVGAAVLGFVVSIMLSGPILGALEYLVGIRIADVVTALLMNGISGGAIIAAAVSWIYARRLGELITGFGVGLMLHLLGQLGGTAIAFGVMKLLAGLELLRERDFESLGRFLVSLLTMAAFLTFPFVLTRLGLFPRPIRWRPALSRTG